MVAAFVLIAGVLLIMLVAALVFTWIGSAQMLTWMVPWAPALVLVGSFLLMLAELPLFLGGRHDRRAALRDLAYLFPAFVISGGLWYLAQHYLW